MPNPAVIKAAAALLSDERTRKGTGWIIAAILSPVIILIALICSLGSGTSGHNASVVELCFNGGVLPPDAPAEYVVYIEDIRSNFALLDTAITTINENAEEEKSLDGIRVKAIFFALYFGADSPGDAQSFADCFVTYEERTRTVTVTNEDGEEEEQEETYTVAIPIEDLNTVYQNIGAAMGITVTEAKATAVGYPRTPTTPSCWCPWGRPSAPGISSPCPAPQGGLPDRMYTSRSGSTGSGQIQEVICHKHREGTVCSLLPLHN